MLPTLAVVAALATPAVAHAGPLSSLRAAKLHAASGTLTIKETRCAQGSSNCGTVQLLESFDSGDSPRTSSAHGRAGFRAGLRIRGKGSARCQAESPSSVVTGPDGSQQFLGPAQRVTPGGFRASRVAMTGGRNGARIVWLEPLAPSFTCKYFDQPGTELAVPMFSSELVSSAIGARRLKRTHFSVTIAGTQGWTRTDSDGTQVTGQASWKLRLSYRR